MQRSTDLPAMGFFDIGAVGLPAAVVGIAFVLATGRWLLPDRRPPLREPEQAREYAIEMLVQEGSPLVGKSIEQAGLRQLPGAFLAEIERADALLPAVAPTERLRPGDRLLFVGVVESVLELVRVRGLVPAPEQLFKLDTPRPERRLFEVVVSDSSPVAGKSIREGGFRRRYEAVVIAVARNGERLRGKVGDIVLRPGDTLLLEGRPAFAEHQRNSRDFLLIHELSGSSVPRHDRAWVALSILALMVAAAASGLLSMFEAALAAAALTVLTRCATSASARASIDWSVLAVIGASLGIGQALLSTGAAAAVASWWLGLVGNSPWTALLGVYLLTSLFTSLITNNAAAVLIFPIALSAAEGLGVSPMPFVVAVMMAASASFATPISYQTNLMVYGPGGYRFSDYLRLGLPLNLLLGAVVVVLTPLVWPFVPDA
jgi:di/tricarboxylate transporter